MSSLPDLPEHLHAFFNRVNSIEFIDDQKCFSDSDRLQPAYRWLAGYIGDFEYTALCWRAGAVQAVHGDRRILGRDDRRSEGGPVAQLRPGRRVQTEGHGGEGMKPSQALRQVADDLEARRPTGTVTEKAICARLDELGCHRTATDHIVDLLGGHGFYTGWLLERYPRLYEEALEWAAANRSYMPDCPKIIEARVNWCRDMADYWEARGK